MFSIRIKRKRFKPETTLVASVIVAIISVFLIAGVAFESSMSLMGNVREVTNVQSFGQAIDWLFVELKDAEVAEQKFLLTGKMIHLKFYRESVQKLKSQFESMEGPMLGGPELKEHLARLRELILQDEAFLERRIRARDDVGLLAAIQVILTGEGARIHDAVESLVEQIKIEQQQAMVSTVQSSWDQVVSSLWLGGSLILLFVFVLLAAVFLAGKSISARRRKAEYLVQERRDAINASQAKSDFLATMSHEIRTPMTTVIGMLQLLMRTPLNEEQRKYVKAANGSSQLLLTIVNDVLDVSKIEAGKIDLETIPFEPSEIVSSVSECFTLQAREKGVEIRAEISPSLPRLVLGDPIRLRQILINLCSNALKFTKSGHIRIEANGRPDGILLFAVQDTGIGISEEARSKLFEKFSQANKDTTRKYGGTGLGLSICKSLSTLMGGEIGVESRENFGSRFWFTIRAAEAKGSMSPRLTSSYQPARDPIVHAQKARSSARVLLAEDDSVNRMIITKLIEELGFSVDGVGNGVEVLSALSCSPYGLVLMDCQMPELDGFETTRRIRRGEGAVNREVPIVALTANLLKTQQEECLRVGMNDHLSKPVDEDELERVLKQWLSPAPPVRSHEAVLVPAVTYPSTLDVSRLKELFKMGADLNDHAFGKVVVSTYLASAGTRISSLGKAIQARDMKVITLEAHTLGSSSANLGVRGLSEICGWLEDFGGLSADDADPMFPKALAEFNRLTRIYQSAARELEQILNDDRLAG